MKRPPAEEMVRPAVKVLRRLVEWYQDGIVGRLRIGQTGIGPGVADEIYLAVEANA